MRDTGPTAKSITGDPDASSVQMGVARVQLGILKNQMAMGGLSVGKRTLNLPDGTTITASVAAGIPRIAIDTPQPAVSAIAEPEIAPPEAPEYEYAPQDIGTVAISNGTLQASGSDLGQLLRPMVLDGSTRTTADNKPLFLSGDVPNHTYAFAVVADPSADPNRLLVCRMYPGTAQPYDPEYQPTAWEIGSPLIDNIPNIGGNQIFLPYGTLKTIPATTKPLYAALMFMPPVCDDTAITITGKIKDGKVCVGKMLVKGQLVAGITGVLEQPLGAASFTLNGVPIEDGGTPVETEQNGIAAVVGVTPGWSDPTGVEMVLEVAGLLAGNAPNIRPTFTGGFINDSFDYSGGGSFDAAWESGALRAVMPDGYGTYTNEGVLTGTDCAGNIYTLEMSFSITVTA